MQIFFRLLIIIIFQELDEDYQVRFRDGVRILIEREIATQTTETFGNPPNFQILPLGTSKFYIN